MIELKAANEPEALLWVNKPAVGSLLRGCWPAQCAFMGDQCFFYFGNISQWRAALSAPSAMSLTLP